MRFSAFTFALPALLLVAPISAFAVDCDPPAAIDMSVVPDGSTATVDQINEAGAAIRAHNAQLVEHDECLNEMADEVRGMRDGGDKDAMEIAYGEQRSAYNDMVDNLEAVVAQFNAQIGIYRANNPQ